MSHCLLLVMTVIRIFAALLLYLLEVAGGGGHKHFPLLDLGGGCHLQSIAVGDKSLSQLCHNTPQEIMLMSNVALLFCTVKSGEHILHTLLQHTVSLHLH